MTEILYKELSYAVVGAAMEVHRTLGPGFLEVVYEAALAHELALRGIPFEQQRRLAVQYKGQPVGEYVADLIVDGEIILELKAVSKLTAVHEAQAHNYLAATGLRLAIILNFGAAYSRSALCDKGGSTSQARIPSRNSCNSWQK